MKNEQQVKDEELLLALAQGRKERIEARRLRIEQKQANSNPGNPNGNKSRQSSAKKSSENNNNGQNKDGKDSNDNGIPDMPLTNEYQKAFDVAKEKLVSVTEKASTTVSDRIISNATIESQRRARIAAAFAAAHPPPPKIEVQPVVESKTEEDLKPVEETITEENPTSTAAAPADGQPPAIAEEQNSAAVEGQSPDTPAVDSQPPATDDKPPPTVETPQPPEKREPTIDEMNCYELDALLRKKHSDFTALIQTKNEEIQKLKLSIRSHEQEYSEEIARESQEILNILAELNKALMEYRNSIRQELDRLEAAWMKDRNHMIKKSLEDYESLLKSLRAKQQEYLETYPARTEINMHAFDENHLAEQEDEKHSKAKLEQDMYSLILKLQDMKATFALNVEKLEYNYQVLKKREEENAIIVAHQKRKINRLNDTVTHLSLRIRKQQNAAAKDLRNVGDDYVRIQGQWKEFNSKFNKFRKKDLHLYREVAEMFAEDIEHGVRDIVKADKVIWESVLGADWNCPGEWKRLLTDDSYFDPHATLGPETSTVFTREEWITKFNKADKLEMEFLQALEEEVGNLIFDYSPLEDDVPMRMERILRALDITSRERYNTLKKSCLVQSSEHGKDHLKVSPVKLLSAILEGTDRSVSGRDLASSSVIWSTANLVIDNAQLKVWDTIFPTVQQYQHLLQQRFDLTENIDGLTKENEELRSLIDSHLSSETHDKLQIPPENTKIPSISTAKIL